LGARCALGESARSQSHRNGKAIAMLFAQTAKIMQQQKAEAA
jgi:hypothetical protein